jgi:8-oxo-dGTP pyrophosphatase MutT (NUDIX family)
MSDLADRFKPYAAALVFFIKDDSILLMRRFNTGWADGQYTVPSGHIEAYEPVIAAAARESYEEAGLQTDPADLEFVHVSYRHNTDGGRIYVDFFFVCKKWIGEPTNAEPDKCDDVRWFPLSNLPENIVPFVKKAIDAYQQQRTFSEYGWAE